MTLQDALKQASPEMTSRSDDHTLGMDARGLLEAAVFENHLAKRATGSEKREHYLRKRQYMEMLVLKHNAGRLLGITQPTRNYLVLGVGFVVPGAAAALHCPAFMMSPDCRRKLGVSDECIAARTTALTRRPSPGDRVWHNAA
jgi:hypothetical protein